MTGFKYERLRIVMDGAAEKKKWEVYRDGSFKPYKKVEQMGLTDVVNYLSQENGGRMVSIYMTSLEYQTPTYDMWLEKQEKHECSCQG